MSESVELLWNPFGSITLASDNLLRNEIMKRRSVLVVAVVLAVILFIFLDPTAFKMMLEIYEGISDFITTHERNVIINCETSQDLFVNLKEFQTSVHSVDADYSDFQVKLSRHEKYKWKYSGYLNVKYRQFAPAMNEAEYELYVELISVFKRRCETFNITYMLSGGSVLGSYRFHGFVPWDDDFDVQVKSSDKQVLKTALSSVPGYGLYVKDYSYWKFYGEKSDIRPTDNWKWPFIDIFFFADTKIYVYDNSFRWPRDFYRRSNILPLQPVIFENMILPAPRYMETYLSKRYDMHNPCVSNKYDHRKEKSKRAVRIPCSVLYGVYATVHRYSTGSISYEELRLGNKTLYKLKKLRWTV